MGTHSPNPLLYLGTNQKLIILLSCLIEYDILLKLDICYNSYNNALDICYKISTNYKLLNMLKILYNFYMIY